MGLSYSGWPSSLSSVAWGVPRSNSFQVPSCWFHYTAACYRLHTGNLTTIIDASTPSDVQCMTLNCIHIFIVTGSFLYWCVMRPASQRFFIHSCIYLRILIVSYLATFLGTNSLSMCWCAVKQSINQSINKPFSISSISHLSPYVLEFRKAFRILSDLHNIEQIQSLVDHGG